MDEKRKIEIGQRVEKVRMTTLNNISKNALANKIGMSGQNLGLVIRGKGSFSLDKLISFCEYADVSSDYILFGKEHDSIDIMQVNEAITEYNNKYKS